MTKIVLETFEKATVPGGSWSLRTWRHGAMQARELLRGQCIEGFQKCSRFDLLHDVASICTTET